MNGRQSGKDRGEWPIQALPRSWTWTWFDEVFINVTTSDRKIAQKDYASTGNIAIVDQGQSSVAGYTSDESLRHPSKLPVIVFGDHTQCVKFVDFPFVQGADGVKVIRPSDLFDPRFAYHALRTVKLPNRGYSRHFKFLSATEFPLPPLNEQRRIVTKLEALQARSRRAREALDAVPPMLEKLRQSILAAAFRGDLTKDWRAKHKDVEPASELLKRIRTERRKKWEEAELAKMKAKEKAPGDDRWKAKYKEPAPVEATGLPELPERWCWATVDQLTWSHDGRRVPVKLSDRSSRSGPYPYYGAFGIIDHVNEYIFDATMVLIAEDGKNLMDRKRPVSLVADGKYWVNNHAHVLEAIGSIPHRYLSEFFNSVDLRSRLTGIDQVKLTAGALATLPVPVAPHLEQLEISRAIDTAMARIANLRPLVDVLLGKLFQLERAYLANAFCGELVPQDPNDEPAEILVARLQDGCGAASAKARKAAPRRRRPGIRDEERVG